MGILYFFKTNSVKKQRKYADSSSIDEDEKEYYQPDEYYSYTVFTDSAGKNKVMDFDDYKEKYNTTKSGLYVGEIMLLYYVTKGDMPKPKKGYQSFWWFKYGIRDVGHALKSIEHRNFIEMNNYKYKLTEKGENELKGNIFVPFYHKTLQTVSPSVWDKCDEIFLNNQESKYCDIANDYYKRTNEAKSYKPNDSDIKEIEQFIRDIKPIARKQSQTNGSGFEEEMLGIYSKQIGDYENALYMGYISIYKKFDAPALYIETAKVLRKFKQYKEELWVIEQGIKNVENKEELEYRKERVLKLIEKSK